MGEEKDLPPGRRLVEYFMPFLLHLAGSGLSKRTIQNHVDNMWLLGGEIIRGVNEEPILRKFAAEQLVRNVVHDDGGPLTNSQRLGGRTALLRLHLSEVPPLPQSTPALIPSVTHRFPGRRISFLGDFSYSADPSRPAALVVPLSRLPADAITFTLGDSMSVAEQTTRRVYKLDEMVALFVTDPAITEFGLSNRRGFQARFIELQLWDGSSLRAHASHSNQPTPTFQNRPLRGPIIG